VAQLRASALSGIGEVVPGDDLAELILATGVRIEPTQILAIAHKVVSKAEGRIVKLEDVRVCDRARELARRTGKDPRQVQVILEQSVEIVRAERGVIIARTHQGFVCANAGVDGSNAPAPESLVLLPADPDASARALRARMRALAGVAPGILITDSFGRPWRVGQQEIAIGAAGLRVLEDLRGERDGAGRTLQATWIAVADQIASAADLVRSKSSREPVVIVTGMERHRCEEDGPGARELLRARAEDLFT
jgi:coenzyme F420-0:L-glutamate ligase/coenzyme F420-1:gamma-L-glutamate ligase